MKPPSKNNGERLIVRFSTRIPVDKTRPLVVGFIQYILTGSGESAAALKDAARTKYGSPSFTAYGMDYWCTNPIRSSLACAANDAQMTSSSGMLTVFDPAYDAAVVKYIEESRKIKPNI